MKPTASCSLIALLSATLSLTTVAASAPDTHCPNADVKPEVSDSHIESAVTAVAGRDTRGTAGGLNTRGTAPASRAAAFTAGGLALSPRAAARFRRTAVAAARNFSREMGPVTTWANRVKTTDFDTPLSGIRKSELSVFKQSVKIAVAKLVVPTGRINKNIVRLAVEHDVHQAVDLCQEIRIDALKLTAVCVDLKDYNKNGGSLTTKDKEEIALLLKRARMLRLSNEANERVVQLRLNRLQMLASRYAQDFQAIVASAAAQPTTAL